MHVSKLHYLLTLAATLAVASQILLLVVQAQSQSTSDNLYQREHSLVKPYQGGGMVSLILCAILTPEMANVRSVLRQP